MEKTASALLKELSDYLCLDYYAQDWGIINASPKRTDEFLEYFEMHPEFTESQKYHLGELIIASFNEALIKNEIDVPFSNKFKIFISKNQEILSVQIRYWSSLKDLDEFPVADILKAR